MSLSGPCLPQGSLRGTALSLIEGKHPGLSEGLASLGGNVFKPGVTDSLYPDYLEGLLKMQILEPHHRPMNQILGIKGLRVCILHTLPGGLI